MTLKRKFLAAMTLPVVVLLAATALAYVAERRVDESAALVTHTFQVRASLDRVLADVVDAETGTRGYLLTGRESYLAPYVQGAWRLKDDLEELDRIVRSPVQRARLDALRPIIQQRIELLSDMQELAPIDDRQRREELIALLDTGKVGMEDIRSRLQEMQTEALRLLTERQAALDAANHASSLIQLTVLPGAMLLSLILVAVLTERVVRRIRRIEENARRLEAGAPMLESDATGDELGSLARRMVWTGTQLSQLQEELRHMATVDALTGLMNRRGFLTMAENHLALATREHRALALMFVDVDGLKEVNDRLGHAAGDELIREAGIALQETFRTSDVAARVGGDEFCILLTAPSALDVPAAIDRLRAVEARANAKSGRRFPLSLSVGVADLPDHPDGTTIDDLMAVADERMYEDKRRRRQGNEHVQAWA